MNNTFGRYFSMRSFGESHGPALGVVVDGCPAGVKWDQDLLLNSLARRRPGQSSLVSARQEGDQPEVLSGVYEGQTLGTPIAIMVRNHDARPEDYAQIAKQPRLGHADDVWRDKFGHADPRGGGRSSGRETVARVMAGAVAQMFCQQLHPEIRTISFARQIGPIAMTAEDIQQAQESLLHKNYWMDQFAARLPHEQKAQAVEQLLNLAKQEGKSYGGVAQTWIKGVPRGLGQPVFHKLKNDLAAAVMSVGATSGVSFGDGFAAAQSEGSEYHRGQADYGGLRGGLSTGEVIRFEVAFKPTSSVLDIAKQGRHDPCIVPRALPVIDAMVWVVLADHLLAQRLDRV